MTEVEKVREGAGALPPLEIDHNRPAYRRSGITDAGAKLPMHPTALAAEYRGGWLGKVCRIGSERRGGKAENSAVGQLQRRCESCTDFEAVPGNQGEPGVPLALSCHQP